MTIICNKVASTGSSVLVAVYCVLLNCLSIFISAVIEFYTNHEVHVVHNYPDIIRPIFNIQLSDYNSIYAGLSSVICCFPFIPFIFLYVLINRNKQKSKYYSDIVMKTYIIALLNILVPLIYLIQPFHIFLGHRILYAINSIYILCMLFL